GRECSTPVRQVRRTRAPRAPAYPWERRRLRLRPLRPPPRRVTESVVGRQLPPSLPSPILIGRLMRSAFALMFGCAIAGRALAAPTTVERVVAVVNSEIILLSEAKERASQMGQPIDDRGSPAERRPNGQQLKQVVDRMVEDTLVLQQAAEL